MPNLVWPGRWTMSMSVIGSCLGSQIVNVFHFQATPAMHTLLGNDDGAAQTAAAAVGSGWWTNLATTWRGMFPPNYSVLMIRTQVLEKSGTWHHVLTPSEQSITTGNSGTQNNPATDATTSLVLRWRTPLAGKHFRGRTYVGPLAPESQNAGLAASGLVTAGQAFQTAMLARYGPSGSPVDLWDLTIYSKPFNKGTYGYPTGRHPNKSFKYPDDYAGAVTNVTTVAVDSVLRTQRRREIGVGS